MEITITLRELLRLWLKLIVLCIKNSILVKIILPGILKERINEPGGLKIGHRWVKIWAMCQRIGPLSREVARIWENQRPRIRPILACSRLLRLPRPSQDCTAINSGHLVTA
jgi:hypothetical protein